MLSSTVAGSNLSVKYETFNLKNDMCLLSERYTFVQTICNPL